VSDVESSVQNSQVSSAREDSKYLPRESAASVTLQRRLEGELAAKMKRLEELMLNERELQQTINQLKNELERRQDEAPSKAKQIEAEVSHKFEKEVEYYKQETEKFIVENTQLKKELVTKSFEIEELKRAADYSEQQLRYR
jgi:vacuolar-type H+-ATPase subunit H